MKILLSRVLNEAEAAGGKFQIRYQDYEVNQWTAPVCINQKRIADMMDDSSVKEIRIILSV